MPKNSDTKKQHEQKIRDADNVIEELEQSLVKWVDYRNKLMNDEIGTIPSTPPPPHPPK